MQQLSSSLEDYLEAIWTLGRESGAVRVKNIGELLDVSAPSVVGALQSLTKRGLVTHERYGYVELTERGEKLAREVYRKHHTLEEFFTRVLGVDTDTAARDACAAEHNLSIATLERIRLLTEFAERRSPKEAPRLKEFQTYIKRRLKSGKA